MIAKTLSVHDFSRLLSETRNGVQQGREAYRNIVEAQIVIDAETVKQFKKCWEGIFDVLPEFRKAIDGSGKPDWDKVDGAINLIEREEKNFVLDSMNLETLDK